ncbi:MAG TPA: hypothetical protein VHP34_11210 [Alphaproteobacteria bacterium]|nr:hypothetical protein [Alphaproteobacteria bacterium]
MKSIDAIRMRPVDNMVRRLVAEKLPECSFDGGKTWVVDSVAIAELHVEVAALLLSLAGALEPFAEAADGRKSATITGAVCFSQPYLKRAREALWGKK